MLAGHDRDRLKIGSMPMKSIQILLMPGSLSMIFFSPGASNQVDIFPKLMFKAPSFSISVWMLLDTISLGASSMALGAYRSMNRSPLVVDEIAPFAPARLCHKDIGTDESSGMELNEFHILDGNPCLVSDANAASRIDKGVRGVEIYPPVSACGKERCLCAYGTISPFSESKAMTPWHRPPSVTRARTTHSE